jgi:uncharacterized protein YidB (DUF937 family)
MTAKPQLVDKITPEGNVPNRDALTRGLGGLLQGFLGRH